MNTQPTVYTIGHSDHPLPAFIELLRGAGITAVADVRSSPYSRFHPQFNREPLKAALDEQGIAYVFLGDALGARPDDPACYRQGVAEYELIAGTEAFQAGLTRVLDGADDFTIALMCAEKEPLDCHRTILVARNLERRGARIRHILADGSIEEAEQTESRLLKMTKKENADLFAGPQVEEAYALRARQICYREQNHAAEA